MRWEWPPQHIAAQERLAQLSNHMLNFGKMLATDARPLPCNVSASHLFAPGMQPGHSASSTARSHRLGTAHRLCNCHHMSRRARCMASQAEVASTTPPSTEESRADDVLPDSFTQALEHAAQATKLAVDSGSRKCLVEILLSGLWDPSSGNLFAEEGDQQRFWKITRKFVEQVSSTCGAGQVKALYPDVGVAAMLRNEWKDAAFSIAAIGDKEAVAETDGLVVIAAIDPQGLNAAKRVVEQGCQQGPVILFNPRLASGDVGIGLNVRRMRTDFLSAFTVTYSLRPLGELGTIFRKYPNQWQVFIEDASTPGRYNLAAESKDRPTGDDLDEIIAKAEDAERGDAGGGMLRNTTSVLSGFMRFLGALSR